MSAGLRRPTGSAFGLRFSLAAAVDRESAGGGGGPGIATPAPPLPPPVAYGPGVPGGRLPAGAKAIVQHRCV
jgi:hypothetical protein